MVPAGMASPLNRTLLSLEVALIPHIILQQELDPVLELNPVLDLDTGLRLMEHLVPKPPTLVTLHLNPCPDLSTHFPPVLLTLEPQPTRIKLKVWSDLGPGKSSQYQVMHIQDNRVPPHHLKVTREFFLTLLVHVVLSDSEADSCLQQETSPCLLSGLISQQLLLW